MCRCGLCICLKGCVHVYVYTYVYTYMEIRGQNEVSLLGLSTLILRWALSLNLEFTDQLGRLTVGIHLPLCFSNGTIDTYPPANSAFYMDTRNLIMRAQVLVNRWWAPYWLSHLSSPRNLIYIMTICTKSWPVSPPLYVCVYSFDTWTK